MNQGIRGHMSKPTSVDMAISPANLLTACEERLRAGQHDLPIYASPAETIAALCRRLIAAEAKAASNEAVRRLGDWLAGDRRRSCSVDHCADNDLGQVFVLRLIPGLVVVGRLPTPGEAAVFHPGRFLGWKTRNATPDELIAHGLGLWSDLYLDRKETARA